MHTHIPSAEELQRLLEDARTRGLSMRAQERLQWLLHYRQEGCSVSETCRTFGITRVTFYRLLRRFDPTDLSSLEDQVHRMLHKAKESEGTEESEESEEKDSSSESSVASDSSESIHHCIFCTARTLLWPRLKRAFVFACVLTNIAILVLSLLTAFWETDLRINADLRGDAPVSASHEYFLE